MSAYRDTYAEDAWPGGIQPLGTTAEWRTEPARLSVWTGLGLIVSVVAVCATLTGLLAPEAAAVGVLGFLISDGGLVATGNPIMSSGVAALALLVAVGAVALAVLAMSGDWWPNSRTDEISTGHALFVDHRQWLNRW